LDAVPDNTICNQVESTITLNLLNENPERVEVLFLSRLLDAINEGRLTHFIRNSNLNSPISETGDGVLLDTRIPPPTEPVSPPEPISLAAIIGIASAAFAAGILTIGGLYTNRERTRRKRELTQLDTLDAAPTGKSGNSSNAKVNALPPASPPPPLLRLSPRKLAAGSSPGKSKTLSPLAHQEISADDIDGDLSVDGGASEQSSSSAGNSGWSSSAGVSSHNTGSFDSHDLESGGSLGTHSAGRTLVKAGATGAAMKSLDNRHRRDG
jgi:hypothetical protein